MKDTKKYRSFDLLKAFNDRVLTKALVSLDNSLELSVLFRKLGWRVISACFSRRTKLPSRLRFLGVFLNHIMRIRKHYGSPYTVKYLKACQLAVQKALAGTPLTSLREVDESLPFARLDRRGLPRIIPLYDRRLLLSNGTSVIRFWLTLFSLYRIIDIPGKLKLSTITDKLSVPESQVLEVSEELRTCARDFSKYVQKPNSSGNLLLLESASSTSVVSWLGLFKDPALLVSNGLHIPLLVLIKEMKLFRMELLWDCLILLITRRTDISWADYHKDKYSTDVGQLQIKKEPAGKVRVFAMVDVWTQSVLKPLHDSLFQLLKSLPNDATFDQRASVRRCFTKVQKSNGSFGYDLSAATDRLPISLQVTVLSEFFGSKIAEAWKDLLINRDYVLTNDEFGSARVRYSVGQPMGALSSWAMLAVTHHLLVQVAALRCQKTTPGVWYDQYELLGDDIVLFDELVANNYLSVMKSIGVEINLSKSVIAVNSKTFEFAKVTGHNGKDVSALSWKSFISQNYLLGRTNIAFSLLGRELGISNWVSWVHSFTKRNRKAEDYNTVILGLWSMFSNSAKLPFVTVLSTLLSPKSATKRVYRSILLNANIAHAILTISKLLRGHPITPPKSTFKSRTEEGWMKIMLSKPLLVWGAKFQPMDASAELAKQMVIFLLPGAPKEGSFYSLTMSDFKTIQSWTPYEHIVNGLFLGLYSVVFEKINSQFPQGPPGSKAIGYPLEKIVETLYSKDRVTELLDIVKRAEARLNNEVGRPTKLDSPLKVIKIFLKGSKSRPKWTLPIWEEKVWDLPTGRATFAKPMGKSSW